MSRTKLNIERPSVCFTPDHPWHVQYLKSQLDTMRTMSESRNRIYEEVDRTAQDLEKTNQKLTMEARADKQKIDK